MKILINAHVLINAHTPNLGKKIVDFFTYYLEISASNKCPSVNLEKISLQAYAVSFRIYCLIISKQVPFSFFAQIRPKQKLIDSQTLFLKK